MDKGSLRGQYGKTLSELGETNPDIIVLDADLAKSTKTITFGSRFPRRFLDMGLSEQDMVSTAAGIALTGKTVFASSFAVFLTGRVFDQVRQSVCYNYANVKLVATHSGLGVGEDGATHQALEDIALMRTLPGMRVIIPSDPVETDRVIRFAAAEKGPFYIRLTRSDLPVLHSDDYLFRPHRAEILKEGSDITIISAGSMLGTAMEAADILQAGGIRAEVINSPFVKPLDEDTLTASARKTGHVITIEDHSVYGGLGSAVAELLIQRTPVKMKIMGVDNQFGRSGKPAELYELYGLTPSRLASESGALLGK